MSFNSSRALPSPQDHADVNHMFQEGKFSFDAPNYNQVQDKVGPGNGTQDEVEQNKEAPDGAGSNTEGPKGAEPNSEGPNGGRLANEEKCESRPTNKGVI